MRFIGRNQAALIRIGGSIDPAEARQLSRHAAQQPGSQPASQLRLAAFTIHNSHWPNYDNSAFAECSRQKAEGRRQPGLWLSAFSLSAHRQPRVQISNCEYFMFVIWNSKACPYCSFWLGIATATATATVNRFPNSSFPFQLFLRAKMSSWIRGINMQPQMGEDVGQRRILKGL